MINVHVQTFAILLLLLSPLSWPGICWSATSAGAESLSDSITALRRPAHLLQTKATVNHAMMLSVGHGVTRLTL